MEEKPAPLPPSRFPYSAIPAYIYLNRIPLLFALALAGFAPAALWLPPSLISSMFGGIFDISDPVWWRVFTAFLLITASAWLAGDIIRHMIYAISYHAPDRFRVPEIPRLYRHRRPGQVIRAVIAISIILGALLKTNGNRGAEIAGMFAGLALAYAAGAYVQARMHAARPELHELGRNFLAGFVYRRIRSRGSKQRGLAFSISNTCYTLLDKLGNTDGYLERDGAKPRLAMDHEFGAYWFLI